MEETNVIELSHISKSFPGIKANDDISLTLRKGEIHALLGENGAGKSTLMSILFGMYSPDEGEIFVRGEPVKIKNPNDATKYGIGMVHQHFKLVECYTALENIILGFEPTTKYVGFLRPKMVRKSIEDLCEKYHFDLDIDTVVEDLPVGAQQKVEILKMLYRENEVLIFDEPTAVLTPQEIDSLMQSMKQLAAEGKSILFISHKLNEIMEVSDRVSVLRKGKLIATVNTKDTNPQKLSNLMVGRDVKLTIEKDEAKVGNSILSVNNLVVYNDEKKKDTVNGVSFDVKEGEIVCIAGIEGNGQSDLIYALTGLTNVRSGEAILHNVDKNYYKKPTIRNDKTIDEIFANSWDYVKYGLLFIFRPIGRALINAFNYCVNKINRGWLHTKFAIKEFFSLIGLSIKNLFKKKIEGEDKPTFEPIKEQIKLEKVEALNNVKEFMPAKKKSLLTPKSEKELPDQIDVHLEDLSIRRRNLAGVSHIPEDRHKHGLILDFSLTDNLTLQKYFEPQFQKFGVMKNKAKVEYAERLIEEYDIRSGKGARTTVGSMSGGNQQKVIIAREIDRGTPLLIAVQPTRGLDVGAIEYIHRKLINYRDEGKAVLLVSFELEEVMNVADRILVMFNGKITAELNPKETNVKEIGLYMSGAKRMDFAKKEEVKEGE